MSEIVYNPWPNGQVPKYLQRPELDQLKEKGYLFNDAREVCDIFEKKVADFAGCKYAVSVDCATHAMELSLRYLLHIGEIKKGDTIIIPNNTYVSAAIMPIQLGFNVEFENIEWEGCYQLKGTRVVDAAVMWKRGMYDNYYTTENKTLYCISFQIKKIIPIGRGGMILTNDQEAAEWLKLARYDGRDMSLPYNDPDHIKMQGWHYYMTPEDCARGILLMDEIKKEGNTGNNTMYPDVKKMLKL